MFRDADIRGGVTFSWSPLLDVKVTWLCEDAMDIKDWTPVFTGATDVWLCGRDDSAANWSTQFNWDVNDGGDHKCETDVGSAMLNVSGAVGDDCFMPILSSTDVINCTNGGCTWVLGVSDDGLVLATDAGLLYPNIRSDMDNDCFGPLLFIITHWLDLGLASNGSPAVGELVAGSDRSSSSCFNMTAGRGCRPVMSNRRASARPFIATNGDGEVAGDCRINWTDFSGSAEAPVLALVMSSSLLSSRSFRPTSCDVWNGSADVDVDCAAASSGLVGVPCFRRRRCSINGTAWGELQSGRVPDNWDPAVEKLHCEWCWLDGQAALVGGGGNDGTATCTLYKTTHYTI